MWVRKRLDIGWRDLAVGLRGCLVPPDRARTERAIGGFWSQADEALACLSVRSGFDLLLDALDLPPGCEVLVSALTIPDMVRIVEEHGLVAVPVDLDVAQLAPDAEALQRAITPRTRLILVAHLCGGRIPLGPLAEIARRHNLLLVEDCAQAFAGRHYLGHPAADVSMFSFGTIKTATALGGAVLRVRDAELLDHMRAALERQPTQPTAAYLKRVLKYALLKCGMSRPIYSVLLRLFRLWRQDYDRWLNSAVRGFAGPGFFDRIRHRPSTALLTVLERRLRCYPAERVRDRAAKGALLVDLLQERVSCPGAETIPHTHWVFPVLVEDPARVIAALCRAGFDATQGHSLCAVAPPPDRPELDPRAARQSVAQTVYLPFYPELPRVELERMAEVLLQSAGPLAPFPTIQSPALSTADSIGAPRNAGKSRPGQAADKVASRRAFWSSVKVRMRGGWGG